MRTLNLLIAFLFITAGTAVAQPTYAVVDLGALGGGHDTSALAINDAGHVVGAATDQDGRYLAFLYVNSLQALGTLGGARSKANAINSADQVVGNSSTAAGATHAFLYNAADATPTMMDLHSLIGFGGTFSSATAINAAGHIVGAADDANGNLHAFLLTGTTAVDLHASVSFGGPNSFAYSISANGWIAGVSDDANGHAIAFFFDPATSTLTNLGTLGGPNSVAMAVNASGGIAGNADVSLAGPTAYAFLTLTSGPIAPSDSLGALGGTYSFAHGMNAQGDVVGEADDAGSFAHAFLYTHALGMQDLESLIPPGSGWILSSATAINDSGYIVGNGVHGGRSAAFLLTPATTPVTVDTSPSGLTIVVDGVSATAPTTYHWTIGSQHQLTTDDPQQVMAQSRIAFSSWSDSGALVHAVTTPSSATTYTATFKTQYLLTTSVNPPAGGSITSGNWFDSGSVVTITATPASGYAFTGFSGDLSADPNPGSVTMDAARTVAANFKGVTATGLSTSPNPSAAGQAVTLTAVVTSPVGVPTGTVTFNDGGVQLGTATVNGSGQAAFGTSSLSAGTHTITVEYGGDAGFVSSTAAPVSQVVNDTASTRVSTRVSLRVSPNPVAVGQSLTVTASVAPVSGNGHPSGQVTFFDEGVAIGTSSLVRSKHKTTAALRTSVLTAGTHVLTAMYLGDTSFSSSTSSPLAETVYSGARPASTSTRLASSLNPSPVGQAITFTATVKASRKRAATPTGIVQFFADGNSIGSAVLVEGKRASTAQVTNSQLAAGSHKVVAVYLGDPGSAGSTSARLTQVVQ